MDVWYIYAMASFRLDRSAFKAQSAAEASASHALYYKVLTSQERCRIAGYLNSIAYNFPEGQPPRLDRTQFSARARSD